jgi:serine/threonine protein kinase
MNAEGRRACPSCGNEFSGAMEFCPVCMLRKGLAGGGVAGTPEFASPEQFAGVGVDIRSDLYSLGVVLWEMVTGHAVFRGSPAEVMYQHQHAPLPQSKTPRGRRPE